MPNDEEDLTIAERYAVIRREGPGMGVEDLEEDTMIPTREAQAASQILAAYTDSMCWVNIYAYTPFTTTDVDADREKRKDQEESRLAVTSSSRLVKRIRLLTSAEEISVSHNHTWEGGGMMGGMISGLGDLISKVSSVAAGQHPNSVGFKLHKLSTYQDSDLLQITVPVILFTYDDPVRDVLKPLAEITYMSYPVDLGHENAFHRTLELMKDWAAEGDDDEEGGGMRGRLRSVTKYIEEAGAAMYNAYQYATPHFFQVAFSNQILRLPSAAITNIEVTYHSPWLRGSKVVTEQPQRTSLLQQVVDAIRNVDVNVRAQGQLGGFRVGFDTRPSAVQQLRALYEKLEKGRSEEPIYDRSGYPLFAEAQITFQALEPSFANDFWPLPRGDVRVTSSGGE